MHTELYTNSFKIQTPVPSISNLWRISIKNSTIRFSSILPAAKFTKSQYLHSSRQFIFLAQIERHKSDFTNYFKYWDRYEQLRDSINKDSHYENIRMVQSMFNYQHIADEKIKYEKEAAQRMIIIYRILIISAILLIIGFFILKKEQKKKKKLLDLKEQLYKQSQRHLEDNKKQIQLLENELSNGQETLSDVKKQLFEAQKLMLEMENRQICLKQNTLELLEQDLKKSSLYIKIHKAESGLIESEWSELALLN